MANGVEPDHLGIEDTPMLLQEMDDQGQELFREIQSSDCADITKWIQGAKRTKGQALPYMLKVFLTLKRSLSSYCAMLCGALRSIENKTCMLDTYCDRWEEYASSAEKISTMYLPYTKLLNEMIQALQPDSDQPIVVNLAVIMSKIWYRHLYSPLAEVINGEILDIYKKLRDASTKYSVAEREEMITMVKRATNCLLDISIDPITIREVSDPQWKATGPYLAIYNDLKDDSIKFVQKGTRSLPVETLYPMIKEYEVALARTIQISSYMQLRDILHTVLFDFLLDYFKRKYIEFVHKKEVSFLDQKTVSQLVDTYFGLYLFHSAPSKMAKSTISSLIHALINESAVYRDVIDWFNQRQAKLEEQKMELDYYTNPNELDDAIIPTLNRNPRSTEICVYL